MTDAAARNPLLDNSLFILTGGHDVTGNVLLSVPTNRVADIGDQSVADLTSLFLRMMEVSRYVKNTTKGFAYSGAPPIAFLADLRQAPTQVLYPLVEVLEAVEHNQRGAIAAVYFLKPKSSSKSHILKKLLGVKPSKKRPRAPLFKIVLMKTIQELYAQVDMRFLTSDFSGTLKYSHHAWMYMYENVVVCIEEGTDLLSKLPSIRDRVDILQEYEPDGQSSVQLQQLLTDLTEKFHHIITESSLPTCLTRCKQTLFSIDNITSGSLLSSLHPNLLSGFCSTLHTLFSELDQWNKSLEDAWRVTESHFTLIIQYNRHNEKANEIERKICDHYYPLLKEHPIVGRTLSQAELYRAHFTTTLYEPAKELLSQATEILEAMQKVKTSAASLSNTGVSSSLVEAIKSMDISSISRRLTTSIQPFTVHMQQLQELYVSIHVFHLLFEKALSWYKKVLKFLPESLLHSWTYDSDISQSDPSTYDFTYEGGPSRVIYMPPEWLGAVRVFLDRHPPPRDEHINRLDVSTPNVVDKKLRAQARSLALRLRLLQRVLSSTRLPLKLLMAVTGWKFELFGASHSDRSPGHTHPHSHMKEMTRNANFQVQSEDDESTAQENKWVSSSNVDEARNDSSGTTSQSKKSVYFDQSTTSSMKSSTDKKENEDVINKADQLASKRAAIANRIQTRKNSKTLLRAKSVEFSFNSSSTDGSVFDYEKAVSQANEIQGYERQEEEFLKIRSGLRNAQKFKKDEKPFHLSAHGVKQGPKQEDIHQDVPEISLSGVDRDKTYFSHQGPLLNVRDYEGFSEGITDEKMDETFERNPDGEFPSPGERYIGLSYRSWPLQPQYKGWSRYHSMDDLLQADQSVAEEEFESGIDTMDHAHLDPYDLVVKKIKDISASNLPNFEKLKYVSSIIANSQMSGQEAKHQLNAAKKLSFSSYDLRDRNFVDSSRDLSAESGDQYKISQFPENPVEAVVRMKQNLAKSMENLSTYQLSMLSDDGGKSFSKLENPSPMMGQNRYLTKMKMPPSYANSVLPKRGYETAQMSHPVESNWQENYNSQAEGFDIHDYNANRSKRSLLQDINEARPSSDSQMQNEVSHATKRHSLQHTLSGIDEKEQQSQAGLPHSLDNHWQQNRKTLSRPTTLNFSTGRTFISPSFLRPASSMRNISTQGQEKLTFDLLKSMNLDSEKDLTDSFENKVTLEEKDNADNQDVFSQENLPNGDTGKNSLDQGKDDSKSNFDSTRILRRKFPSFDQTESGYKHSHTYFNKRPWSLSIDPTVYPVFDVEEERHNLTFNPYDVDRELDCRAFSEESRMLLRLMERCIYLFHSPVALWRNEYKLNSEAELAGKDQEEVAHSLLKTQQILEEEEQRRIKGRDENNDNNDSNHNDLPRGQLIQSESIDNGYGSWASKLISAQGSSSDGTELDNARNAEDGSKF